MEKEWHKIISFNGSQANAFEELVCQIAMAEGGPKFKTFERVGTPDGGVECYWQLNDHSEWGWQAKYYNDLDSSAWNNIKKSLFDAVETHPQLTRYFICLPHNLADGRRGNKTQKLIWENHKERWTKELSKNKRKIDIVLWNSSLVFSKLSRQELYGTRYLFFNEIEIKEQHLNIQLENSIISLGPKYSASLNLKIENINKPFAALSRNKLFKRDFENEFDGFLIKFRGVMNDCNRIIELKRFSKLFAVQFENLLKLFSNINFLPVNDIPVQEFETELAAIENNVAQAQTAYHKLEEKYQKENEREKLKGKEDHKEQEHAYDQQERYKNDSEIERLNKFNRLTAEFKSYIAGTALTVANEGVLILRGDWGTGKSHLLADLATEQRRHGLPSVFILGMNFTATSPRIFIQQSICPKHNLEDYLSALNAFAQTKGERIFFIIDAINEGPGKFFWKDNIKALINEFRHYKWIGLVISYRTTYEKMLIPEDFRYPKITHTGFQGMEDFAIREFFNYYKIQQTVPLLNPEFATPLFLKIFCATLRNLGLDKVEEGFEGISKIFGAFVQSINAKIGERLGYPHEKINLVQRAIDNLLDYQLKNDAYVIPYEEAHSIVQPLAEKFATHKNFIEELLKENLLTENYYYQQEHGAHSKNGISFSYERMIDHFKAKHLITGKSLPAVKKAFRPGGQLYALFVDKHGFHGLNTGLLNALTILLPEKFDTELYEIFPLPKVRPGSYFLFKALVESILWRRADATGEKLWVYIRAYLKKGSEQELLEFYNVMLQVCANKGNYFNADFLHHLLFKMKVAERDYLWTVPVDKIFSWYENNSVKRLINWCWNEHIEAYRLDDETAMLIGKTLVWFFSNANRYIRDQATKAFVALFTSKIHLLTTLVNEFKAVNDPYILERLMAGIYGATARSNDKKNIAIVAKYIYAIYFKTQKPPTNILTRDYCKGIVESAINKGVKFNYPKDNLYPPFNTHFPTNIPDEHWVKSLEITKGVNEKYSDQERGFLKILVSVKEFGDFSRYIIGTNHKHSGSFAVYETKSRLAYETILKTLKGNNKKFLKIFVDTVDIQMEKGSLGRKIRSLHKGAALEEKLKFAREMQARAIAFLEEHLNKKDWELFLLAGEYIRHGLLYQRNFDKPRFDLEIVARYILQRVFEMGWTKEFFGEYDCRLNEHGRTATKAERIGKKYQWIAYYEIMALLTDHYDYYGRYGNNEEKNEYRGAWQERVRNLDPSVILKPVIGDKYEEKDRKRESWWFSLEYKNWFETRKNWLNRLDDLPDIKRLLVVTRPGEQQEWYILYGYFLWEQEKELGVERYKANRRDFWIDTYCFLANKASQQSIIKAGTKELHWLRDEVPDNNS